MSQFIQKIDNLGRREATTLAASTTQRVFATLNDAPPTNRQVLNLTNCDSAADLYVRLAAPGEGTPSVLGTDCDLIIPARGSRQLQIGMGIEVWVRHSGGGAINYSAVELL